MPARSKLTKENIATIVGRLRDGATNYEAIDGVMTEETFYKHMRKNPEFAGTVDMAKEYVTEIARGVVAKAIKRGDRDTAKWWLERKARKEFSTRSEVENSGTQSLKVEVTNYKPDDDSASVSVPAS